MSRAGTRALKNIDLDTADALHSAAIHLLRRLRTQDDALGLSAPRLSALSVVVFGGPVTITQLAAAEQVSPATISRMAKEMEWEGLLVRERDPPIGEYIGYELQKRESPCSKKAGGGGWRCSQTCLRHSPRKSAAYWPGQPSYSSDSHFLKPTPARRSEVGTDSNSCSRRLLKEYSLLPAFNCSPARSIAR